jgi:Sec-independent protein secretion pathway component TatC
MKLKIISDDGSIQGWFVAFLITFLRLTIYVANYIIPGLREAEKEVGAAFTSFCLLSVGSWFAYRVTKPLTEGGKAQ